MSLLVDRKVLQSQYSRNNLNIHYKLVSLYVTNLNSLATTSALIAGLSFSCIHEWDYPTKFLPTAWRFGYFYSLVSMLALISAILALSQTTICLNFGPTMFLFGDSHADSLNALNIMKVQQNEGYFWSFTAVLMALLQSLFFVWGVTRLPLACILTVVHLCGYYLMYTRGLKTMKEFLPKSSSSTNDQSGSSDSNKFSLKQLVRHSILGLTKINENHEGPCSSTSFLEPNYGSGFSKVEDIRNHLLQIRRRGYIWTKNSNKSYQTDHFVRVYLVLENGELTFYREKEDFVESNQPITSSALPLKFYALTTSKRMITQYTHPPPLFGVGGIRQVLTGTHEMKAMDYVGAKFDILTALVSYKFSLIPTSENELLTLVPLHFMTETEEEFREWVEAISEIQNLYHSADDLLNHVEKTNANVRLHQDAQASLKYANIVDRLPDGMEV